MQRFSIASGQILTKWYLLQKHHCSNCRCHQRHFRQVATTGISQGISQRTFAFLCHHEHHDQNHFITHVAVRVCVEALSEVGCISCDTSFRRALRPSVASLRVKAQQTQCTPHTGHVPAPFCGELACKGTSHAMQSTHWTRPCALLWRACV